MAPDGSQRHARPRAAARTQPREERIQAPDGTSLFVRAWDAPGGAPLILCDGLGCDGFVWRYIVERFAGERPLVHVHYRGHGRSEVPRDLDSACIEVVVDDMAWVLDAVGVDKGVWLGHSMGVQVCLEAVRRLPARVTGLGLLCGSFERPIDTWHHAFFEGDDAPLGNRLMRRVFPDLTRTFIEHWGKLQPVWRAIVSSELVFGATVNSELNPDLVRHEDFRPYMHHLANMDMRVFARLARSLSEHSTRDLLPHIDVPTLIVGGGRDRFAPLWVSEEMHRLIPDSEILRLVQGSHTAPIEEPRLVERALLRLLARLPPVDDAG